MAKYILLGIIQGITEFLPISSSGHLVIMQRLLGLSGQEVAVLIVLHLGTALALVIFFFKDILNLLRNIKLLWLIIVVTVITGLIGITGKDCFERLFVLPRVTALALMVTGVILILSKKFMDYKREALNIKDALILGITQGMAIIPGISRSGITISTLLFRKIDRKVSFRFSFLAAIPAVFGASLLKIRQIGSALNIEPRNFLVGFIFSFLTGILALKLLKVVMEKAKLYYFGYYCIILAVVTVLFLR